MLRLIHSQTVQGAILVDDIDDGLPNKMTHRLGSVGDPQAYPRDGYANQPKQPCYVPRVKASNTAIAGYIDLDETSRVLLSAASGKIAGLLRAGRISVVSFVASDLAAPTITAMTLDAPAAGDITITGTGFLSVVPEITSVRLVGAGVGDVTLTKAQIEAVAPGAVGATSIVIDSTLIPGLADGDVVVVTADAQSATRTLTSTPVITGATPNSPALGDLTIAGTDFSSYTTTVVHLVGTGVGDVTLTKAQIEAVPPGTVTDTSIVIDSTLIPGLADGDTVTVTADGIVSNTWTVYTTPVITGATPSAPAAGDLTIAGTAFASVSPNVTSVHLVGAGVGDVTLTKTQIEAVAPGTVTNTSIVIDSTLIPGLADGDTVTVTADTIASNTWTVYTVPAITGATPSAPAAGDLTIAGTAFASTLPNVTSVHLVGAGVGDVTLTKAQIEAVPPGTVTNTSIVIDSTLIPGLADGDTVTVTADGLPSNTWTVYTTPDITAATLGAPALGDVTIDGSGFASVAPTLTSVHLTGAGVGDVTLTETQIVAVPPGAVGDAQIIIDSTLIAGLTTGDSIVVTADGLPSNTFVV